MLLQTALTCSHVRNVRRGDKKELAFINIEQVNGKKITSKLEKLICLLHLIEQKFY